MNHLKIIFWTPFNRARFSKIHCNKRKPHPALTEEWIIPRFKIWKETCLQSILNQTCSDFKYFFCCDPATKYIIDPLFDEIKDPRVILQYTRTDEALKRINDLRTLNERIISIRLDSDDMYHPDIIIDLVVAPISEWYAWTKGYGYHHESDRLWHYNCINVGPFFAHFYNNAYDYSQEIITDLAHDLIKDKRPEILSKGRFIVGVTGMNTTTSINSRLFYKEIFGFEKDQILKDFGL